MEKAQNMGEGGSFFQNILRLYPTPVIYQQSLVRKLEANDLVMENEWHELLQS